MSLQINLNDNKNLIDADCRRKKIQIINTKKKGSDLDDNEVKDKPT